MAVDKRWTTTIEKPLPATNKDKPWTATTSHGHAMALLEFSYFSTKLLLDSTLTPATSVTFLSRATAQLQCTVLHCCNILYCTALHCTTPYCTV